MKRWALILMLAAATLLCAGWIHIYGVVPRLGIHDSYNIVLALLIGLPLGSATGYLFRDRVLLRSFLAALPTAVLAFLRPLLFGEDLLRGILGPTALLLSYCGSAYFVSALLYKEADFAIYRNASGAMVAVSTGWSWPAFFFTAFWALYRGMWLIGLGAIAAVTLGGFALAALAGSIARSSSGPALLVLVILLTGGVPLVVGLIFGVKGNSWRQQVLLSRGFSKVGTAVAKSSRRALTTWPGANAVAS